VVLRCRVVLASAEGVSVDETAARLETNRKTVMLWRKRFEEDGLEGV
jgi:transposase